VKTILKRTGKRSSEDDVSTIQLGDIQIDQMTKKVITKKEKIDLTRKEFEILAFLARHSGRIFSRNDLLNQIWEDDVIVTERTVDVNIARLRKKMGEFGQYIKNKPGYGYYFEV
jgi:DNA-binding response OmpR family regulator